MSSTALWPPVSFLTKIRKHGEVGRVQTLKSDVGSVIPGGSDSKASVYNVRDLGSIPGLGRFPGEGNGNPLQYSCLENPIERGAWCRLLSMGSQSFSRARLSDFTFFPSFYHFHTINWLWDLSESMCPHLDNPVARWDFLSPWGVRSSWCEPMCKSKSYPQSLGILEDYYLWTYYSPGSNSKLLCPLLPHDQIASETVTLPVSTRESIHTECLVISLQVWGWQELMGLERGQEGTAFFISAVTSVFPLLVSPLT